MSSNLDENQNLPGRFLNPTPGALICFGVDPGNLHFLKVVRSPERGEGADIPKVTPWVVRSEHTACSPKTPFRTAVLHVKIAPVCPLPKLMARQQHRALGSSAQHSRGTPPGDNGHACHQLGMANEFGLYLCAFQKRHRHTTQRCPMRL